MELVFGVPDFETYFEGNGYLVGGFNQSEKIICSSNWIISPGKGKHKQLVGGSTPFKKNIVKMGIFPK